MKIKKQTCKDSKGNIIEVKSYDLDGRITSTVTFDEVKTFKIKYVYNDNGDVLSETTLYRETSYHMMYITKTVNNVYDNSHRLVASIVLNRRDDSNNMTKTFIVYQYEKELNGIAKRNMYVDGKITAISTLDYFGNVTTDEVCLCDYDEHGNATDHSKISCMMYNDDNKIIRYVDISIYKIYSYDDNGNLVCTDTDTRQGTYVESFEYNSANLIVLYKDSKGVRLTYSYEYYQDNILNEFKPNNIRSVMEENIKGEIVRTTKYDTSQNIIYQNDTTGIYHRLPNSDKFVDMCGRVCGMALDKEDNVIFIPTGRYSDVSVSDIIGIIKPEPLEFEPSGFNKFRVLHFQYHK